MEFEDLPSKNFSSMWLFLDIIGPTFCGLFSKIICTSRVATDLFGGFDLKRLTNSSHWSWGVIDVIHEIVVQSHKRASDRPPNVITDQMIDSSSCRRDILFCAALSFPTSPAGGSSKNKWTIFLPPKGLILSPPTILVTTEQNEKTRLKKKTIENWRKENRNELEKLGIE